MDGSCRATPRTKAGLSLQPNVGGNLNAAYAGGLTMPTNAMPDLLDYALRLPNGLEATNVSTQTWFGVSPDNSGFRASACL